MQENCFFTIGIPVYNAEKYISTCLDSVLNQSFIEFEVLCVNDGSTDRSSEIIEDYSRRDKRVKCINKDNGGPSSARNVVVENAQGRYIYFFDSDDIMTGNALEKAYLALSENEFPDILQLGLIRQNGEKTEEVFTNFDEEKYSGLYKNGDERTVAVWTYAKFLAHVATRFVKTDLYKRESIRFPEHLFVGEDRYVAYELYRKADRIVYERFSASVHFMNREGSIITQASFRTVNDMIGSWVEFYEAIEKWDLSDEFRKHVEKHRTAFFIRTRRNIIEICLSKRTDEDVYKIVSAVWPKVENGIKTLDISGGNIIYRFLFYILKTKGIKTTVKVARIAAKIKR